VSVIFRNRNSDIVRRDLEVLEDVVERFELRLFQIGHFVLELDDAAHDGVEQNSKRTRLLGMHDLIIAAV
jgi:hypothetical protein